jgi:hypothetical protein
MYDYVLHDELLMCLRIDMFYIQRHRLAKRFYGLNKYINESTVFRMSHTGIFKNCQADTLQISLLYFNWTAGQDLVCTFTHKTNTNCKSYSSLTCKTLLGTFQIYYCFCRQKKTSQFLFFLKPRPLPPRFLIAILDKEDNT